MKTRQHPTLKQAFTETKAAQTRPFRFSCEFGKYLFKPVCLPKSGTKRSHLLLGTSPAYTTAGPHTIGGLPALVAFRFLYFGVGGISSMGSCDPVPPAPDGVGVGSGPPVPEAPSLPLPPVQGETEDSNCEQQIGASQKQCVCSGDFHSGRVPQQHQHKQDKGKGWY